MLKRIQLLGRGQRIVVFVLLMVGGLLFLAALTVLLILLSVNNTARGNAVGLEPNVTVTEFAVLPDDDAFPAAVAVAPDGTLYTGSYQTGVVWAIAADGTLAEIPGTRDAVGAVSGLDVAADGALYILDRETSDPRAQGGVIWRWTPQSAEDDLFAAFARPGDPALVSPDDIAVDANGFVYVTDRGTRQIVRLNPDGSGERVWWTPPHEASIPTGITYDPSAGILLVTDSALDTVYRIPTADASSTTTIFAFADTVNAPGFDGITVTASGEIYAAALSQNGIVRLRDGVMTYIAGPFRGASDVAALPDGRLVVTNWDSRALLLPAVQPQLPFALDLVTFAP